MIRVWQNGRLSRSFATGQGAVTSLLLLPDGTVLSGGRDGTLRQWSLDGRASRAPVLQTHQGTVWTIAQLRNGDLLTGGDDGNLRRWRAGRQVALLDTPHNTVVSLVVHSNGDWITGGSGGALQVWRNSKPLGSPFLTGLGNLWMLTDRRDGSLVSTNGNGSVKFYPTPRQAILRACKKLRPIFFLASTPDEASAEARQLCAQTPSQPAVRGS
jgi:WD40 repeat protein